MLPNAFSQFHFLRPEWFLALIPVLLLIACLRFEKKSQGDWQHIIPQHLLKYLLHEKQGSSSNAALSLLAMLWLLSTLALAGPTWQKVAQPVYEKIEARVYVLDLSYSMYAADIKPNRIIRARLKLLDLLNNKREGLSALVVFSGDAHVVTPLTNDINTISSLVPALEPSIMPNIGSNAKAGVLKAFELLANTKTENGEIILITDEVLLNDRQNINALLESSPYTLSIMSVGSKDGAPIKLPNGQFLKDNSGAIVIPKVNEHELERLASDNGGRYVQLRQDDKDVRYLHKEKSLNTANDSRESQQNFDLWLEAGQWLMFPILLLAALAFRKGWLLTFLLLINLFPTSDKVYADELLTQQQNQTQQESQQQTTAPSQLNKINEAWQALWLTGDQRGLASLQAQNFSAAAKQFNNQDWKAIAHYYNGQFAQAAELFNPNPKSNKQQQADTWYNQGNALARAGYLDGAIAAYDKSLALNPENEDAAFNKQLVEALKEKQSQQQQDQNNQEQQNDKQNSETKDNQTSEQQNSEQTSEQKSQQNDSQESQENSTQQSDQEPDNNNTSDENKNTEQQQSEQESEQEPDTNEENTDNSEDEKNNNEQNRDEQTSNAKESEQTEKSKEDALSPLEREKQQALEQWLREVPDDPSGLMRRKFEIENKRSKNNSNTQQQAW